MKTLSEFIKESLIEESESIKSEKDFRNAAEAKFKKVFGDELDEDYMELWKDRKIEKARENYPEAQQFYFERPYSDMSYGELLACGDF